MQPGSSIMPGKVNPVLAEVTNMVCFQVLGGDLAITLAAQAGQLELNVMMPVIAYNILFSMEILKNCVRQFARFCVAGISANPERCRDFLDQSVGLATVLAPSIGYAAAAEVAKESAQSGKSIRQVILARAILSEEALDRLLSPYPLTSPGVHGGK
jgi:aspartate ammonia-lyase